MKEQDKADFNEWSNENDEKIRYAKLVINAFADAYLCLSDVQIEQERNKLAFMFVEQINAYIQARKIQTFKTDNERLNIIFDRVKRGIDAGFVDCMNVCNKNNERTKAARQAKQTKRETQTICTETGEIETAESLYFKYWKQAKNRIYYKYQTAIDAKRDEIENTFNDWEKRYYEQDKNTGLIPIVHPKSREQDTHNNKIRSEIMKRVCAVISKSIGQKITYNEQIII